MTALWIALAAGMLYGLVRASGWWRARGRPPALGFVSSQWVAEQRVSQAQLRQR